MQTGFAKQGLRENRKQFAWLLLVNAFVGGMVGMERTIFPQFANEEFGVTSQSAILTFITVFGLTKAFSNYYAGRLANRIGRKNLLLFGWLLAIPVPLILIFARNWHDVILANAFLGVSQGLTWSSTVVMKIDLVGERNRGLAMGLNEFSGYLAVGLVAYLTGYLAGHYGITPFPFYTGIILSVSGFLLTLLFVKDTRAFVHREQLATRPALVRNIFWETTWKNKTLSSVTQAGFVNNLNDGMIWGLFPAMLMSYHYDNHMIGIITAIYPAVWGLSQIITGKMADKYSRKKMLFWGMLVQGLAILLIPYTSRFSILVSLSVILGLGTALVYPTFLTAIAQATVPRQRAESIGTFRLWRDLGYAFGAIISGVVADMLGIEYAVLLIGFITIASSMIIRIRMPEQFADTGKECVDAVEVKHAMNDRLALRIIDVRSLAEYEEAHIPGAVHIDLEDIRNHSVTLDTNWPVVTVCGKGGGRSVEAASLLRDLGYRAWWLCGGTFAWLNKAGS